MSLMTFKTPEINSWAAPKNPEKSHQESDELSSYQIKRNNQWFSYKFIIFSFNFKLFRNYMAIK